MATSQAHGCPSDDDCRRKHQRRQCKPEGAARDVRGHRQALAIARHRVHERRGRRMKRGAAEPPNQENRCQHRNAGGRADGAQDHDRENGTGHQQHSRTPAIGQRAETQLRHRTRQLVAHREDADRLEREASCGISSGSSGAYMFP